MKNHSSLQSIFASIAFLACTLFLCIMPARAQESVQDLEKKVNQLHGKERLDALLEITQYYISIHDERKALRFARQAEDLAESILIPENPQLQETDLELKPQIFLKLGKAYEMRGRLMESKGAYMNALESAEKLNFPEYMEEASSRIRTIDSVSLYDPGKRSNFFTRAVEDIGKVIDKSTNEFGITASLKLARMYAEQKEYEKSINQFQVAKNLLRDMGDFDKLEEVEQMMAEVEEEMADAEPAEGGLGADEAASHPASPPGNSDPVLDARGKISAETTAPATGTTQKNSGGKSVQDPTYSDPEQIRRAAQNAESRRNLTESIDYYKQYISMQQQLQDERANQQLALLEKANEIENRDREILLLKQNDQIQELELTRQQDEIRQKKTTNRNLAAGTGLLGAVLISLYFLYFNKQRAHRKLTDAYQKLESTQNQLKGAQKKIKDLLQQQVSGAVADELLASTGKEPIARRFVCIMFLDIRDFTVFAEELNPEDIIEYQNKIFGFMIDTVNKHHGIVNQILGDGFMATFGAPVSSGHDCQDAYMAAREIIQMVNKKSTAGEIPPTKVGIGLHAGYVVTGNVGTSNRKQYSITGNPVIIASRLEQLNKDFGSSIVISKDVYDNLPDTDQSPMQFQDVVVKGRSRPVAVAAI